MKENEGQSEENKDLTYDEKVYTLGEFTAGLIKLHLEEPAAFTKEGVLKTIFNKYEALGLEVDKSSKGG